MPYIRLRLYCSNSETGIPWRPRLLFPAPPSPLLPQLLPPPPTQPLALLLQPYRSSPSTSPIHQTFQPQPPPPPPFPLHRLIITIFLDDMYDETQKGFGRRCCSAEKGSILRAMALEASCMAMQAMQEPVVAAVAVAVAIVAVLVPPTPCRLSPPLVEEWAAGPSSPSIPPLRLLCRRPGPANLLPLLHHLGLA